MEIRICCDCGIPKELEAFYMSAPQRGARSKRCKPCESIRRRARYQTPEGKASADANTKRWMTENRDRWNEMQARNWRRRTAAKRAAKLESPPP